jgi:crossover junction endonuclease EME1
MIEGLDSLMRKNKNSKNKSYQAAILSQMDHNADPSASQSATGRKTKGPPPVHVDEDMVDDALLRLQITHGCLVQQSAVPIETAEWISVFTQQISLIPAR